MTTPGYLNQCGEELENYLRLRTSPIALKLLEKATEVPAGAKRPKPDLGVHLAMCQAFAMVRRQRVTLALLKEDHWCWAPLIGYGLVKCEEGDEGFQDIYKRLFVEDMDRAREHLGKRFPRLEFGKFAGLAIGPLRSANFEPDLVLIYSNTAQLRSMLLAVKYKTGALLASQFDPIDSCVFSVVPPLLDGEYRITLPDPGEYERAMAGEDEIIFSVPTGKLEELMAGLRHLEDKHLGYTHFAPVMQVDFPQPDFYRKLFRMWGLDGTE
jgi:uncharacterized protein (DUF169 family)